MRIETKESKITENATIYACDIELEIDSNAMHSYGMRVLI